jgi:hypothetical protein
MSWLMFMPVTESEVDGPPVRVSVARITAPL